MEIYVTYANDGFKNQIEYSFRLISSLLGLRPNFVQLGEIDERSQQGIKAVISYGSVKPKIPKAPHVHIYESEFWSNGYLTASSLPQPPLPRYNDLPVLYSARAEGKRFVNEGERGTEILIDIVASVFFLATQYEAVIRKERDQHNRFPASASLSLRENFLHRPLVHEYVELLWQQLQRLVPEANRPSWLPDADIAVLVSHDIDVLRKYSTRSLLGRIIDRAVGHTRGSKELRQFFAEFMRVRFHRRQDPYQSFNYLLDREAHAQCRASFYFRTGRGSPLDGPTYLRSKSVRALLSLIQTKGSEIGLHGSYHSAYSLSKLRREKAHMESITGQPIVGNRFHYLRFCVPDTWRYVAQAGLQYDATLGFADSEGFRCGMCLPFRPYDLLENREIPIWEIPLIVMDTTLRFHRGLSAEQGFETVLTLMETVKRFNGVFVIVWHNSSFDEELWAGWKKIFEAFLDRLRDERCFCGTGAEIIGRWERYLQ